MSYLDSSLLHYVDDLSARLPAPGGGSAAALAAALGSALDSMVLNFTVGNEKCRAVENEAKKYLAKSEQLRKRLIELVQADVAAYGKLAGAYKMPKSTPEEQKKRAEEIQTALKASVQIPGQLIELASEVLNLSRDILPVGNPNLVSDTGVAVSLAWAGMESGLLNVEINLRSIKDAEFCSEMRNKIKPLIAEGKKIKEQVFEEVYRRIVS